MADLSSSDDFGNSGYFANLDDSNNMCNSGDFGWCLVFFDFRDLGNLGKLCDWGNLNDFVNLGDLGDLGDLGNLLNSGDLNGNSQMWERNIFCH